MPVGAGMAAWSLDKPIHIGEYFLLTWGLIQTLHTSKMEKRNALAGAVLIAVSYGALLEGVQAWLPYRQAEWRDVLANTVGSGLAVLAGRASPGRSREP